MPSSSDAQKNLVRNDRVQEALAAWGERKDAQAHSDVLRRAVSGSLLLDISHSEFADPEKPMQQGDKLVVTSVTDNAGKDLLLAFTDNPRLEGFGSGSTGASLAQPAESALKMAMDRHDGIAIDAGTDGAFIAYSDEMQRAFGDSFEDAARLASAIVGGETSLDDFVAMLRSAVVYIGGIPIVGEDAETLGYNLASATKPDGSSLQAVFTGPAELWAWEPNGVAQPTTLDKIVEAARENGMSGLVVNPVGPSAELRLDLFD